MLDRPQSRFRQITAKVSREPLQPVLIMPAFMAVLWGFSVKNITVWSQTDQQLASRPVVEAGIPPEAGRYWPKEAPANPAPAEASANVFDPIPLPVNRNQLGPSEESILTLPPEAPDPTLILETSSLIESFPEAPDTEEEMTPAVHQEMPQAAAIIYTTVSGKKFYRPECQHVRNKTILTEWPLEVVTDRFDPCRTCQPLGIY